jgi:hypothetical protein
MKLFFKPLALGLVLAGSFSPLARANDVFDNASDEDDSFLTDTVLTHGVIQNHDLQGTAAAPDQDWFQVPVVPRHSYEGRMFSQSGVLDTTESAAAAQFDRVDSGGFLQTAGAEPDAITGDVVVRWTSFADEVDYLRVRGRTDTDLTETSFYDIQLLDTTVSVPRFNNSATQVTVFLIENTTNRPVTGQIFFYLPNGNLQDAQPLNLPASGGQILNTATVPGLQGFAGVAQIAHDGPYGAVTGKAVALESATGFTFDTPFTSLPH